MKPNRQVDCFEKSQYPDSKMRPDTNLLTGKSRSRISISKMKLDDNISVDTFLKISGLKVSNTSRIGFVPFFFADLRSFLGNVIKAVFRTL